MTSYADGLPPELWQRILKNVSPKDLCKVMLTSRRMRNLASEPDFCSEMRPNKKKIKNDGFAQFYSIHRFRKTKKINYSSMEFSIEELKRLLNDIPGSPLENLDLRHSTIVQFLDTHDPNIIEMTRNGLGLVQPEVLARAVCHLKTADLGYTRMQKRQCAKIFEAIPNSNSLTKIDLGSICLDAVPAANLARAICHLETVNLSCTSLTPGQCTKLLEAIPNSNTLLNLDLGMINLSGVEAGTLARAVCSLKSVKLVYTSLAPTQCASLIQAIPSSNILFNVNLGHCKLSLVPADILAEAVHHLQTAILRYTKLKTSQSIKLLEAVPNSNKLVNIDLEQVDLSRVPKEILVKAVCSLRTVKLGRTRLTSAQCVGLLEAIPDSTTLKHLDIKENQLAQKVPPNLLASVPKYMEVSI